MSAWSAVGMTDRGKQTINEDVAWLYEQHGLLYLGIFDGFGGQMGKPFASNVVQEEIERALRYFVRQRYALDKLGYFLDQAFYVAHRALVQMNGLQETRMGCAGTMVVMDEAYRYVGWHVGNTRFGLLQDDVLRWKTKDETEVQSLVEQGMVPEAERFRHPGARQLTKAMGYGDITPTWFHGQGKEGDVLVLTTDGIHGVLTEGAMIRLLYEAGDTQKGLASWQSTLHDVQASDNFAGILSVCRQERG